MPHYAFTGGYTTQSWADMIANPGDRTGPVRAIAEAAGGRVIEFYWSFGEDDFLVIFEAPDDSVAAAFSIAVGSSGALRNTRTTKLIPAADGPTILGKAKTIRAAYALPGSREAVGAR